MKIGLQLSYHDAAAQNGQMPPTMWWDHILISLSIFDAVPRHLGDKFIIINSTFKAVESSYPIFFISDLFLWFLCPRDCLSGAMLMLCLQGSLLKKLCAQLMGLALYYQGGLFNWIALLSYPLAESTLH